MSDHDRLAHCFMPHGPDGQWQLASGNCCHTETGWICGRPEAEHPPKPSDPSDRDRLAAIVKERLDASNVAGQRWRTSMSGSIANALIAAGVTMPAPETEDCTDE